MNKSISLTLAVILVLFYIGFALSKKVSPPMRAEDRRTDIYRGRLIMACSPDWSVINADSLGKTMPPLPGSGSHHWDIHSRHDSAQLFFDQGMNLYYGFHIIESMASFIKAAQFDPENPMIHWGKALAYGPNINDMEYLATPEALESARRAATFSTRADSIGQSLIEAIQVRYSEKSTISRTRLNEAYASAMKKVYDRYGNRADVAALYADALMLLHPWKYWKKTGQPEPWTPEIIRVLEKTLASDPEHPGANHYYIHMVEASPDPGKALASADRLPSLMPGAAHMVHMPSHIYIRTGYYQKGVNVNTQSQVSYQNYLNLYPDVANNAPLYLLHNLHMKAACAMMLSSYSLSRNAAQELISNIDTSFLSMAAPLGNFAQYMYMTPLMVNVRYEKWDDILNSPAPDKKQVFAYSLYLWGKGMAQVSRNYKTDDAKKTLAQLRQWIKKADMQVVLPPFNKPSDQMKVGEWMLAGLIAEKDGLDIQATDAFNKAVAAEDNLVYNEPSDWLLPARYWQAMYCFRKHDLNNAEKIIKEDLRINPRNFHSLTLLSEIYSMTNRYKEMEETGQMIKESAY